MTEPTPQARAAARRELTLRRARTDLGAFMAYVFGLELAPHHVRWCEAAANDPRLVILAPVEHGKSTIASIALPLFLLGNNPNARIALVSETHTQAARPLAAIREYIVRNPRLREVFPALRPGRGARERWSDSEIVVERDAAIKDPSIIAIGVTGPLLGARLDLAVLDDVCSFENTFTAPQREKVLAWFRSTVVGRVVTGGRVVVVGTPWHSQDLLHALEGTGEYRVLRDPAHDSAGEPLWAAAWPRERLAQRRREIGEVEFTRQMLLQVLADAGARFRESWITQSFRAAEEQGATLQTVYSGPNRTFTGVDLAVGSTHHDESVLFTLELLPNGDRRVLAIEAGRWQAPELVARIKSARARFQSRVRVETNGAQAYIAHFLEGDGSHVDSHVTGRSRHDPVLGIESLAVEMEQGRWIVPEAPETRAWGRELLAYSPSSHPGDRIVASWLAREAAREHQPAGLPPLPGYSDWEMADDYDDGTWVLGGGTHRPQESILSAPLALGNSKPESGRSHPPFILR